MLGAILARPTDYRASVVKPLRPRLEKASGTVPQLGHFLFHCPFKGGYFSSVDLEIGVCARLREVSAYGKLDV